MGCQPPVYCLHDWNPQFLDGAEVFYDPAFAGVAGKWLQEDEVEDWDESGEAGRFPCLGLQQ